MNALAVVHLWGGQQLVFRRQFTGVDKGTIRTELSERLVQALEIYWLQEVKAYCRVNEDGDVEPIIRVTDLSSKTGGQNDMLVTIHPDHLDRYMAITNTALVMKFDFTRYAPGFPGWLNYKRGGINEGILFYDSGIQAKASFANGVLIHFPKLTKEELIEQSDRKRRGISKEYATFKAYDWKNKQISEISCSPEALASYFEDSQLPYQITPAFFKPEVLQKYKLDPEKYTLEQRSIYARAGWSLKTFDINEEGQVHTYLHYLGDLPFNEQLYWKSFNELPKGPISRRAMQTDFEGNFSTVYDPLACLKYSVSILDNTRPNWWISRGEAATTLHYPVTTSPEEWANAILALDQFVIEGFSVAALRELLSSSNRELKKEWASLRLIQEYLIYSGFDEKGAIACIEPLKRTHFLRTKVKGHLAEREKQELITKARTDFGSLSAHFRNLASDVQTSFEKIILLLGERHQPNSLPFQETPNTLDQE